MPTRSSNTTRAYLVVDDGPAIVASLNFTKKCFSKTLDALSRDLRPDVVTGLREVTKSDREMRPAPATLPDRLIVGPESAAQLTALMRAPRPASVFWTRSCPTLSSSRCWRNVGRPACVEVFDRKRYGDLRSHGKVCLIDDRIAVVGGLALAAIARLPPRSGDYRGRS
jgi:hypothetical protein